MLRFHQPWLDEEVSVQGGARRARRLVMGVDLPSSGEVAIPVRRLRVLYALPEESWRINAYILLLKTSKKSGWSEGFERMEGSLLGYTDEQNDAYLEFLRSHAKSSVARMQ